MTVGPEDFFKRIEESGLLNESIIEQRDRLQKLASGEDAAAELVRQKLLTAYQSQVLLSGDHVPLVIGDYIVMESIGRGGMGYVLKARHQRMKRQVAIKFLLKSLTESDELRRRFEREVEAAAQLDHQNIVTAYDAGVHEGSHYLVMQYVDGEDLSQIVRSSGPLDIPRAVDAIRQAALGLGFAHDRGIIHRDIKPGNLLLDREGVVRILDMGLARITPSPGDALEGGAQADLTNTGSVMGTIDYMAPEQALDAKSVDHRADIYSLGCTLYFLVTGNPPFRNETVMRRLLAHREEPAPRISVYRPDAPVELDNIFSTMMAKSPDDRFASMKDLVVALDNLGLNGSNGGQVATQNTSDIGIGGFAGLPGYESATNSGWTSQPTSPSVNETGTGANAGALPVADADVTILETPGNESALKGLENVEATTKVENSDAGFTGVSETIVGTSPSIAGAMAARASKSSLPWKLIAPVGLSFVALIVFLLLRPDPDVTDKDSLTSVAKPASPKSDNLSEVPKPSDDPKSSGDPGKLSRSENQPPDRRAAEWALSVGGSIGIELPDGSSTDIQKLDELPAGQFVVKNVRVYNSPKVTDDGLMNLRGCSELAAFYAFDTGITDQGLANLTDAGRQPLRNLASLFIARTGVTETGLRYLSDSRNLLYLDIQSNPVNDGSLLSSFPQLSTLSIAHTKIPSEGLSILQELPLLRKLSLDGRQLDGAASQHVSSLNRLSELVVLYPRPGFDGAVLRKLEHLTSLELLEIPEGQLGDDLWSAVASIPALQSLTLYGDGVTDASVGLLPALPELKILTVRNDENKLSGETIAAAVRRTPALRELIVSHNQFDNDDVGFLESLTQLSRLAIADNDVTTAAIETLRRNLPDCRIESDHGTFQSADVAMSPDRRAAEEVLNRGGTVWLGSDFQQVAAMSELPAEHFVVTKIDLPNRKNIEDGFLANFRGLTSLLILNMTETSISDRGLANLTDEGRQPLRSLQRLNLGGTRISETGLQFLNGSSDLWELVLNGTAVSDMSVMSQFPGLGIIDIGETSLTSDDLQILSELSKLNRLTMDGSSMTETLAGVLAGLPDLRALKLQNLPSDFDPGHLAELPLLTELLVSTEDSAVFDDDFWTVVAGLQDLEILMCTSGATDESLAKVQLMPQLHEFTVMSEAVTGEAVARMRLKFPNLELLRVSFSKWTDNNVQQLHTMKPLRQLDLTDNSASEDAIKALSAALPGCQIISDHGTFGSFVDSMTPDRRAAEFALSLGGTISVQIAGRGEQQVVNPEELPAGPFAVTEIELSGKKNIEDQFLTNFRGLADLQILILSETSITDRGLGYLTDNGRQPLPSLQRLYLDGTNVSQTGLQFLSGSPELIGLLLDETATTEGTVLNQFPKLAMLGLGYTAFTADELQALIVRFPQLNYLTMDGRHLSEAMATTLVTIPKLRVLKLRELPSDFDPRSLARLSRLTELYLDADDPTVFDDDFWKAVAGLPELHILMCKGVTDESLAKAEPAPQVEVLIVMSRVVTAEAVVKSMSNFPNVKSLSVNYSDWTDDDIQQLHKLKSLGKLDLTKNSASADAIKALSAELPKCLIISDHGEFGPTAQQ